MSFLLKAGAGLGAGLLASALAFAFWPKIDKTAIAAKSAVAQPVFVASPTPVVSLAPPSPAPDKDAAVAKLADALRASPTPAGSPALSVARGVAVTPTAAAPAPSQASEAAKRLCAQGLVALAAGDIAGARAFLERAAEAGETRALLVLGESYDPATLARLGALGFKGDAAQARDYYSRALTAGVGAARERIAALAP